MVAVWNFTSFWQFDIFLAPLDGVVPWSRSVLASALGFYVKVFYVMSKVLSGELSCPCDRSCFAQCLIIMHLLNR